MSEVSRIAYISVAHTGGSLDFQTPQCAVAARRVDPHGVQVRAGAQELSIQAADLVTIGRFFLAAAVMLGQDLNDGWDLPGGGLITP